jgi:hypothetical protein
MICEISVFTCLHFSLLFPIFSRFTFFLARLKTFTLALTPVNGAF